MVEEKDLINVRRSLVLPDSSLDDAFNVLRERRMVCRKCHKTYDVQSNTAESCLGHPGELVLDPLSTARNVTLGLLFGAGVGAGVGVAAFGVVKLATIVPAAASAAPLQGLTTAATAASASGATSASASAAAAGAGVGSLATAAAALGSTSSSSVAAAAVTAGPATLTSTGAAVGSTVGGVVKGVESSVKEVGRKVGSYKWSCCNYHQSEDTCDGRRSMHLPLLDPEP